MSTETDELVELDWQMCQPCESGWHSTEVDATYLARNRVHSCAHLLLCQGCATEVARLAHAGEQLTCPHCRQSYRASGIIIVPLGV